MVYLASTIITFKHSYKYKPYIKIQHLRRINIIYLNGIDCWVCPVLSVSRVVASVINCRLLCFVDGDGRVLVVCSLGRWFRLMGMVLKLLLVLLGEM